MVKNILYKRIVQIFNSLNIPRKEHGLPNPIFKEIMAITKRERDTIKEHIFRLKRDNIIKRVGSTKAGYWEISDDKCS